MSALLLIIFVVSLLLEGTVTNLPLVFVCLVILTIAMRSLSLFVMAFVTGLLLDAFALRPIGLSSIFLLISIFLMLLYQRKYEINSYPFVMLATFVGSLIYLLVFGYTNAFGLSFASAIVGLLLFMTFRIGNLNAQNENHL